MMLKMVNNNSLINTIPDAWSIHEKFIYYQLINGTMNTAGSYYWWNELDHADYYNSEDMNQLRNNTLPNIDKDTLHCI